MENWIAWFDIVWLWVGRGMGCTILFVLAVAVALTALEKVWPVFSWAKRCFFELKAIAEYLKWRRDH